jgi:hypothetical protein
MPAAARKLKHQPQPRIFHATMVVTRVEEWWVEAQTAEEARALLGAGHGHRAALGERVHAEPQEIFAEEIFGDAAD